MQLSKLIENTSSVKNQDSEVALTEIGIELRSEREKKLLSIRDIREMTCIPLRHINAIESGIRKELPEDFYIIGFIKRYAKLLGLNERKLCDRYVGNSKTDLQNNYNDAFNVLFDGNNSNNIIPFKSNMNHSNHKKEEKKLIKGYHVYFLIGFLVILSAAFLVLKSVFPSGNDLSSPEYLVLEKEQSRAFSEHGIDYEKVESWVDEKSQSNESIKDKDIAQSNNEKKPQAPKVKTVQNTKPLVAAIMVKNEPLKAKQVVRAPLVQKISKPDIQNPKTTLVKQIKIKPTAKTITSNSTVRNEISEIDPIMLRPMRRI